MHEYFQGTVGERIQDLLREKKMTQAVLAQRTQISKATLNRYITDENSRIPHDALLQIARGDGRHHRAYRLDDRRRDSPA